MTSTERPTGGAATEIPHVGIPGLRLVRSEIRKITIDQRLVAVRHRVAGHHRPVDVGQHGRGGRRHRQRPRHRRSVPGPAGA